MLQLGRQSLLSMHLHHQGTLYICLSCLEIRRDTAIAIIAANYDAFEYYRLGRFFVNLLLMVAANIVSVGDSGYYVHLSVYLRLS